MKRFKDNAPAIAGLVLIMLFLAIEAVPTAILSGTHKVGEAFLIVNLTLGMVVFIVIGLWIAKGYLIGAAQDLGDWWSNLRKH